MGGYLMDHDKKGSLGGAWYDDLRSPVTAINPPGAASDPDVDPLTGLMLFDANKTELVYVINQMPHSWIEGSDIFPHVHWAKTTAAAGNVVWRLRYRFCNVGDVLTAWSDPITVSSTVSGTSDTNTAYKQLISSFGALEFPNGRISMILIFEIARIGGDLADTYNADAALFEFDVHYKLNQPGSVQEFVKYADARQYI
jgi:hypothetical protein